ncbi:hypothetical protein KUCAC02_007828 [Chaenocephalus aceratus]|uniref:Uncharacterized protein n=1 Tax=Chaenocephalus aceratus TaxID=36190 RepID=A0ACB9X8F6_CHAAC|nr:hypothetical protein KUCAC02_007828 [Chaenocephalus aceratus]
MYLTLQATRPSMLCNQYKSLRSLKAADFHSYRHLNLRAQACLTMPAVLDGMEPQQWSERLDFRQKRRKRNVLKVLFDGSRVRVSQRKVHIRAMVATLAPCLPALD